MQNQIRKLHRYGVPTDRLSAALSKGISPLIIVNDKNAIAAMEATGMPMVKVYVYREPPKESVFLEREQQRNAEAQTRTPEKVAIDARKRFQKARDIDQMRIDHPDLFDHIIVNTGTLEQTKTQVFGMLDGINHNKTSLMADIKNYLAKNDPKLFIFAGGGDKVGANRNSLSGKDALIKSIFQVYDRVADVVPKMTTRGKKEEDGDELVCQFVPDETGAMIKNPYFNMEGCDLIYGRTGRKDDTKYGINTKQIKRNLKKGKHQCVSLTNVDGIQKLIKEFGKQNIVTVYIHSYRGRKQQGMEDFEKDGQEAFDLYNNNTKMFDHKFFFDGEDTDSLLAQLSNLFAKYPLADKELQAEFDKVKTNPIISKLSTIAQNLGGKMKTDKQKPPM